MTHRFQFQVPLAVAFCAIMVCSCSADFGSDGNTISNQVADSSFVTNFSCASKDGQLMATNLETDEVVFCAGICNPTTGCEAQQEGRLTSALTLSEFDLQQDCEGNCGPGGMHWCGQVQERLSDGTIVDYQGRWFCLMAVQDGVCSMIAVKDECGADENCKIQPTFPYGYCEPKNQCDADADCPDDGDQNACTGYVCEAGKCNTKKFLGKVCDDGDACTVNDVCGYQLPTDPDPTCVGGAKDCDDKNSCTSDSCVDGACVYSNLLDGSICNDGETDLCTVDTCQAGICTHGAKDCDDGNVCTDDSCDVTGICKNIPNTVECDDDDACTLGDVCSAGTCAGVAKDCDDENPCTSDSCVDGTCAYSNLPDGTVCGDQLFCILGTCESDTCSPQGKDKCVQDAGYLAYVVCEFQSGAELGQWAVDEVCGPVGGNRVCIPGIGCQDTTVCVPVCVDRECGNNGCGGSCGACATGELCTTAGVCVECLVNADCGEGQECQTGVCVDVPPQPECTRDSDCGISGVVCWEGFCKTDLKGQIWPGVSGANAGAAGDKTPDCEDNDGDCFYEGLWNGSTLSVCEKPTSVNPKCETLLPGDCDDNPLDGYGGRSKACDNGTKDLVFVGETSECPTGTTFVFMTDGSRGNSPKANEYIGDDIDNDCNGTWQ